MGKQPVVIGVCRGFAGNRILAVRNGQLAALLLEGAAPAAVDAAFHGFGWPMGPCEMQDVAGLDIAWRNRKALGLAEPVADALCEAGRFGQKASAGSYAYPGGTRRPEPDPAGKDLVRRLAAERGIPRRAVTAEEVIERTMCRWSTKGCGSSRRASSPRRTTSTWYDPTATAFRLI